MLVVRQDLLVANITATKTGMSLPQPWRERLSLKAFNNRYTSFVGDGDSSVYPTLLQEVPNYARAIRSVRTMPVSVT